MIYAICWIVLMIVFAVIEVVVLNLNFIWYGVGALAAAIVAVFGAPLWLQCIIFAAMTLILQLVAKPLVRHRIAVKKEQMRKDMEGKIKETDEMGGMEK